MGVWRESGFEQFADGTFGNGGQNVYVSRKGILQRVYRFDIDGDGYADAVFATSQDMNEVPPIYVFHRPLKDPVRRELPTHGAYYAAVGDLNGDGYDDLVVANQNDGAHSDVTAFIYYGSPQGLSERYKIELPAPNCRAVAIGDFNGDGLPDIAFGCGNTLKLFYQTAQGFIPGQSVVHNVKITHMVAEDVDGDGYADLYVRGVGAPRVYWGGSGGIDPQRCAEVGGDDPPPAKKQSSTAGYKYFTEGWIPKIVRMNGVPHLFRSEHNRACFYPVGPGRAVGEPLVIDCPHAVSAAVDDLRRNGAEDLIVLVCSRSAERGPGNLRLQEEELSWIYWGGESGYRDDRRTALPTVSAREIRTADLDGNGYPDLIICQGHTDVSFTTESLIYRTSAAGLSAEPVRLETHSATTVLVASTSDDPEPQLIFVNRITGRARGDIPAVAYLGGPDGFSPERKVEFPGQGAVDAVCCDFDDDGVHDVLIVNCSENAYHLDPGSFLYWGGPGGFRPDDKLVLPTLRAHGCAVGDFRRSGYLDVAFGGICNPELLIFRGGPDGLDVNHPQRIMMDPTIKEYVPVKEILPSDEGGEYREVRWMLTADFNRDGWLDLYVSQVYGGFNLILWGGPDGFSMERCSWIAAEAGACAQAADLDGDGWLDLVIGGLQAPSKAWPKDTYVNIYWGGPDGFREDRKTMLPSHQVNSLTIADFNRDGILDIFATAYHSGRTRDLDAYLYWGQPGGVYSAQHRQRLFAHSSSGCLAIDFNEDGWVDLAVANHKTYGNHNGMSHIWWNGPEGFRSDRITALPTSGPHGMMSVDPGNIMDRGPEEYYISSACELPEGAKVTRIAWEADVPAKTWVKAQLRRAHSRRELDDARWYGADGEGGWFDNGQPCSGSETARTMGRWIQYRLALGAVNGGGSPRVSEVRVEYEG